MRLGAVLALAFALVASPAVAGGRDPAAADVLFRDGRALMKKGDFKGACPKLAESQRLDPAPGTAINLGDCVEKLGKLADAMQAYRDALDLLPAEDRRVGPVKEQIAALEKRVPKLTVKLAPGAPEKTRVLRDDVELGAESLGVALPVNPGEHVIVVVSPRRADARHRIRLSDAQSHELVVAAGELLESNKGAAKEAEPGGSPDPSQAATSAPTAESDGLRTLGLVLAGAGLAGLAFGGVAFYETGEYKQQAKTAADQGADSAKKEKFATAERWQTVGIVSVIAGGAVLAVGSALWLGADRGSAPGGRRNVHVAWTASPKFGALLMEGEW